MFELVVTLAFADYKVGDKITDPEVVMRVLETHPRNVVKVAIQPTVQ